MAVFDEGQDAVVAPLLRWSRRPFRMSEPAPPSSRHAFLLDLDDELAPALDARARAAARQLATARTLHADVGECDLSPWFGAVRSVPGLLVLDGLIAVQTQAGDRTATELIGAGDLLHTPVERRDDLLERVDRWRALRPTRFAVLDLEFADRIRPFPQIAYALLRRSGRRITDIDTLRTITSQPRLEVRLVLLLWHFAARWGRVDPAGIRVSLPLTHRLLGQLVAAERPSVSHALRRLARAGLVTGSAVDLHLHGTVERHLELLTSRGNGDSERGPSGSGRRG